MARPGTLFVTARLLPLLVGCGTVTAEEGGPRDPDSNQPPVAVAAQFSTWTSTAVEGQLAGDDPDGDPLVYRIAALPAGGALALADDGSFRYTPRPGESGADAFSFLVDDGTDVSDQATVDIAIATLTDGTPDATFGAGGAVRSDFGDTDALSGVVVMQDGRIAAVGGTASSHALVAGYSARGGLQAGFGESGNGTTLLSVGAGYDGLGDLVQQATGRLVSVGQTQDDDRDFLLLGLDAQGMLDSSFGGGGITTTDVGGGEDDVARSILLLSDDRLLVAGYAHNGGDDDFVVARYSADGELDESFGTGGVAVVDFGGGSDRAIDVAMDGAGNILLVGEAGGEMGIARLTAEGHLDDGFGAGGKVRLDRGGMADAIAVAVGPDGSIYVGGNSEDGGGAWSMTAVMLTPAGELDTSFGEDGWALAAAGTDTYANDMLLLPNQTLLLVGSWGEGTMTEAAAARLDLSGRLDPAFGADGFHHQAIGSGGQDALFSAALQDDGKVVAAGWSRNADLDALLVRLAW